MTERHDHRQSRPASDFASQPKAISSGGNLGFSKCLEPEKKTWLVLKPWNQIGSQKKWNAFFHKMYSNIFEMCTFCAKLPGGGSDWRRSVCNLLYVTRTFPMNKFLKSGALAMLLAKSLDPMTLSYSKASNKREIRLSIMVCKSVLNQLIMISCEPIDHYELAINHNINWLLMVNSQRIMVHSQLVMANWLLTITISH